MELLLVAGRTGQVPVDLRVGIDPATPGAELVTALAEATGGGPADAWVARTGQAIRPGRPVGEARLVHGDRIELTPPGRPPTDIHIDATASLPAFELTVVGGPRAGDRYPLRAGREYVIGRDERCDITLPDSQVSRQHVHLGVGSKAVVATDAGSANGTFLSGTALSTPTEVRPDQVLEVGATLMSIAPVGVGGHADAGGRDASGGGGRANVVWADGREAYTRPPRVAAPAARRTVKVPTPPLQPPKRKLPLSAALIPVVMGAVMAYFLGPIMLLFALMGPLMMAFTMWEDRRSGRKEYTTRRAAYDKAMDQLEDEIAATHAALLTARRAAAPNTAEVAEWVRTRSPRLWERRPGGDFLTLRAGTTDLPSSLVIDAPTASADPTQPEPVELARARAVAAQYAIDPAVPVDVGLPVTGVLGVAGEPELRAGLVRWLTIQAAALHSPRDLAIVGLLPADNGDWSWMRWLPHTETLLQGLPGARSVAREPDDVRALFGVVDDLVTQRRLRAERGVGAETPHPYVLVVIPGATAIPKPALSRLMADGPDYGVVFVVAGPTAEHLPGECRAVVHTGARGNDASVTLTASGDTVRGVVVDGIGQALAAELARRLAPLSDATAASASGEVPRRVLLLDMLDLNDPTAAAIQRRWADAAGTGDLGAPVGEGAAGPVTIDLRRDGPHGLAAGTTGSGKSELLQSLIGALAATYPASTLTFVLVDYKGGAAFKDCVDLPHTVGFFTDLDAHLARRALVSLNAELRRREEALRRHGCKDLPELEQRFPAGAPANLFIVFDEFAFLKKEVPEFVAGVIDIAQRGRSLGVHLMLATQRPAGVVDDNIRANTNLRIALRMADDQDSTDVLDRPDAARIPKSLPGRGFVRVGASDVTLVQSAYANARTQQGGATRQPLSVKPFEVESGLRVAGPARRRGREVHDDRPTDLQRLVAAIRGAHEAAGIPDQPRPWLDPLPPLVDVTPWLDDEAPAGLSEIAVPLGQADRPEEQAQETCWYDPVSAGHLLVYGTSGAGKSQLLRTVAAGLAQRAAPGSVTVYALDFAGRGLGALAALPCVAAVVNAEEHARVDRLFDILDRLVAERTTRLGQANAASLAEFRAGGGELPYVVVLVDGYGDFRSTYLNVDRGELVDRFDRLLSQGRSVGLTFVITADRRNAVPTSLSSAITERLVMRMADGDEYASLGLTSALAASTLVPGRGFLSGVEVQVAVVGADPSGAGQAEALKRLGSAAAGRAGGVAGRSAAPAGVVLLPERILMRDVGFAAPTPAAVPFGVSGESYGPVTLDLVDNPAFVVLGTDRSGRSTTLETITTGLMTATPGLEAYLLAPRRSPLVEKDWWREVARGIDASDDLARRLEDRMREQEAEPRGPWLVVIDDGDELADTPGGNSLTTLIRRGRDLDLVVLAAAQTQTAHRAFGGWVATIRKGRHAMVLDPQVDIDGDLFGVRLPRKASRRFPPGRGYLVSRGPVDYVQVVLST